MPTVQDAKSLDVPPEKRQEILALVQYLGFLVNILYIDSLSHLKTSPWRRGTDERRAAIGVFSEQGPSSSPRLPPLLCVWPGQEWSRGGGLWGQMPGCRPPIAPTGHWAVASTAAVQAGCVGVLFILL